MPTKTAKTKKKAEVAYNTHLGFLLDESGSMSHNRQSVVESVNQFVDELREDDEGDTFATLSMFDLGSDPEICRIKWDGVPLSKVDPLTLDGYKPHGSTPLNDAVIQTIKRMSKKLTKKDRAMLVILTDGLENASEAGSEDVRKLIAKKEQEGWTFIYLGANQDAWAAGGAMGVKNAFAFTSSPVGTANAVGTSSSLMASYRMSNKTGDSSTYDVALASTPDSIPEDGISAEAQKQIDDAIKQAKEKRNVS
jgi:uncharacterized protein YegL